MAVGTIFGSNFHAKENEDYNLYNQMVVIKGHVQILNHPELGKTPANGMYLLFQRDECKCCLVATNADIDGNYQIIVASGRYKVRITNPNPVFDLLAPHQPRYIDATSTENQFDINLILPKE